MMVAKSWYKTATPKLIARFTNCTTSSSPPKTNKSIEIWTTTCILTNFGKRNNLTNKTSSNSNISSNSIQQLPRITTTLINPANPNLSGPNAFPYFPRGGPQPTIQPNRHAHHIMGYVSQWGGMDVGSGMMFSAETIDGLLHQLGGLRFRAECSLVPPHPYAHAYLNQQRSKVSSSSSTTTKNNSTVSNSSKEEYIEESSNIIVNAPNLKTKCPVGTAVTMSAVGGEISTHYDHIIHTVPPFYNYPPLITNEIKELLGIELEEGHDDDDSEENLHQWSKELLRSCYRQSFHLAFGIHNEEKGTRYENSLLKNSLAELIGFRKPQSLQSHQRVHCPLLGAGCRDLPKEVAMEVAALESTSWLLSDSKEEEEEDSSSDSRKEWVVAFGLLESDDARTLSNCIGEKMTRLRSSDG